MEINDNTILRIKVPAHLYESVKAQLTLEEGKQNFGMPGATTVKEKKSSSGDKPKKTSAPKAKAPKKPKADAENKEVPNDGHKKAEKKPRSIEELKAAHRMIGEMIAEMEKSKKPVEEGKQIEDGIKVNVTSWGNAVNRAMKDYKRVTYNGKDLVADKDSDGFKTQDGQIIGFDDEELENAKIVDKNQESIPITQFYTKVEPTAADPKWQGLPANLRYRGGD